MCRQPLHGMALAPGRHQRRAAEHDARLLRQGRPDGCEEAAMIEDQDLIKIDIDHRIITIFGIRYSMEIFRHLGLGELGSWIQIVRRENGVVTCERGPVGDRPPAPTIEELEALLQQEDGRNIKILPDGTVIEDDSQQDPGYGN
jgi:hypothetical protein